MRALQRLREGEAYFAERAAEARRSAQERGVSVSYGDSHDEAAMIELKPDGRMIVHRGPMHDAAE